MASDRVDKGVRVARQAGRGARTVGGAAVRGAQAANGRRKARAHATTVLDGSVLKVLVDGTRHYVVFSGDRPIAIYPPSTVPVETLLLRADLTKRLRPKRG